MRVFMTLHNSLRLTKIITGSNIFAMKNILSNKSKFYFAALIIIFVSVSTLFAISELKQPFPNYPLYETTLKNGLRVLIYVDSATPIVSTQLWYDVGAIYDLPYKSGMSHLLEHMDNTKHYKAREVSAIVDSLGGEDNAFTSSLYTCYWTDLSKDYYETALKFASDHMVNLDIPESKFLSEQQVVTEERRLGENEPYDKMWEQFDLLFYKFHPYRNPVVGWTDDIQRIERQDLLNHYHNYYEPSNAVCVLAGAVEPQDALKKVEKYFDNIKSRPVTHQKFNEPEQAGEQRMVMYQKVELPAIAIGFHTCDVTSPDYYALEVLEALLSRGKDARLYKKAVYTKQYAQEISAGNDLERDNGRFDFFAMPKQTNLVDSVEKLIYNELANIQSLGKDSITNEEMQRVKNQVIANEIYSKDSGRSMGFRIGQQSITTGNLADMIEYPKRIEAVTKEQIRDVIGKYFVSQNRTVVTLLPEGKQK
jgi:zinc protease